MRQSATQLREPIITIDDIKDQLNLLVHEIRSFSARIDEMSSSPLGLKYGFDCTYDYFFRIRDLKSKTKGIKTPNKPVILLVLMILECLKTGPRSERDIKDFVTEKCRKCGIKATNRGTIAGANLEISSACNILGAMGILEQAHVDDRVEPELFISAALPDPPSEESKVEDYLSLLAYRWSKIIESVVTESQTMEIASSTSINQEKSVTKSEQANNPHPHPNLHSNPPTASHNPRATTNNTTTTGPELSVAATTQTYPMDSSHAPMQDDMDFVDILMQSTEHLEQLDEHHSNHHTLNHLPSTQLQTQPNPSNADLTIFQNQKEPDKIHIQMQMHSSSSHASLPQQLIPTIASNYSSLPSEPKKTDDLSGTSVGFTSAQSQSKNQNPSDFSEAAYALNPSQDLAKSLLLTAGKPAGMTRKSASSTKIWKIKKLLVRNRLVRRGSSGSDQGETVGDDEVTRFLFTPEAFLEKWGENAFHHHASLEVEEKLLRRLASQCSLGFRSKEVTLVPSHVGTRYLDSHYDISASEIVPTISLVQPPLSAAAPSSSSKTSKAAPKTKSGTRNSQKQTTVLANTTQQASEGEQLDKFSTSVDHLRNGSGNALGEQSLLSSHPSSDSLDAMYIEHNDHANNSANNSNTASTAPRELDFSANITAQMLIDKVKKSKRHRGSSLLNHFTYNASSSSLSHLSSSSGVHHLTSAALTNLKNICQASIQGYWGQSQSHGEGREANSSHRRSTVNKQGNGSSATSLVLNNTSALSDSLSEEKDKSTTGAVPVAEYVRTCQQQNIQLTNQYLNSSHFHASQILLNGALPVINTNLFKRYVPPLSVLDYEKISLSTKSGSGGSGGPVCYPDIMITTLEIPWRSIVSEFQIVRSEEMGLSFIPTDQPLGVSSSSADLASEVYRSQSYSDIKTTSSNHQAAPNSSSSTQPHHSTTTVATTPSSSSTSKSSKLKPPDRIHRASSFDSSTVSLPHPHGNHIVGNSSSHTQTATTASISSTIFRCRSVSEVVAPAFREIDLLAPSISPLPSKETNNQSTYDVGIPIDRSVSRDLDLSPDNTLRSIKEEEQTQTAMEVDDESEEGEDSGDEDTSDEAYLSKHDEVLRTMREKWALMQQLKMETRREMMIQGQGSGGSGHGHGLASNKRSFSFQSPYKLQKLSHSHSNDNFAHSNANASTVGSSSPNEAEGTTEKDRGSEGTGNLNAQSEGSPLDGTTSLLGGLISYNSRKRSYSLLNISNIGEVASQLVHGGTSSAGSSTTVLDSNGSLPLAAVKKRGRPPKIQKTSHLHYGKINS